MFSWPATAGRGQSGSTAECLSVTSSVIASRDGSQVVGLMYPPLTGSIQWMLDRGGENR